MLVPATELMFSLVIQEKISSEEVVPETKPRLRNRAFRLLATPSCVSRTLPMMLLLLGDSKTEFPQ